MNTAGDRDAVLDRLSTELADVGRRVERIRLDLGSLRGGPAAPSPGPWRPTQPSGSPMPATEHGPPRPLAPSGPPLGPSSWGASPPPPGASAPPPGASAPPPGASAPPPGASAPGPRRRSTEGLGARLLAITGGVVTLLGVVLLLVLAARSGWFSPAARVVAGAAFGAVLVGAGVQVRRRQGASTGPVALVATGVAALYLDVAAASALYSFLTSPVALLAALLVLGGGLALADRWRHRGLALGALAGGVVLAPVVAGAPTPLVVALLVVAQVVAAPLALRRDWPSVAVLATVFASLGALACVVRTDLIDVGRATTVAAVTAVLAVGVTTAVAAIGRTSARVRGALLLLPLPGVLLAAATLGRVPGATLAGAVAVAVLALALVLHRAPSWVPSRMLHTADPVLAQVAAAAGALAGFEATTLALRGAPQAAVLLGQATLLALLATRIGRRGPLLAAAAYGAVGLVLALSRDVPLAGLVDFPSTSLTPRVGGSVVRDIPALVGAVAVAVLLVTAGVAVLVALARLGLLRSRGNAAAAAAGLGLVGLYGATGTVVGLALLASPTRAGFLTGHVLVTVSWTAIALVLLVRGLRDSTARVLGGVLVVAAVVKLVFFDLTALDGIARVAAFLGAGIVLLVAGTRYARLVADTDADTGADPGADPARFS